MSKFEKIVKLWNLYCEFTTIPIFRFLTTKIPFTTRYDFF